MTQQTRATNTSRFEEGDIPHGTDFADLIDSFVALADTTAQVVASDLKANNFITTGEVSANNANIGNAQITVLQADTLSAGTMTAGSLALTNITAANVRTTQLFVASSARVAGNMKVVASAAFSGPTAFTGAVTHTSVATFATASCAMLFPGSLVMPAATISANMVVFATAANPVTAAGVGQGGKMMCRGLVQVVIGGTTAYVPFFYPTCLNPISTLRSSRSSTTASRAWR